LKGSNISSLKKKSYLKKINGMLAEVTKAEEHLR